ncbi:uncharacterized protein LOC144869676 isoform X2 [Branchiostoma floridae x Branchiostoma japonicum]
MMMDKRLSLFKEAQDKGEVVCGIGCEGEDVQYVICPTGWSSCKLRKGRESTGVLGGFSRGKTRCRRVSGKAKREKLSLPTKLEVRMLYSGPLNPSGWVEQVKQVGTSTCKSSEEGGDECNIVACESIASKNGVQHVSDDVTESSKDEVQHVGDSDVCESSKDGVEDVCESSKDVVDPDVSDSDVCESSKEEVEDVSDHSDSWKTFFVSFEGKLFTVGTPSKCIQVCKLQKMVSNVCGFDISCRNLSLGGSILYDENDIVEVHDKTVIVTLFGCGGGKTANFHPDRPCSTACAHCKKPATFEFEFRHPQGWNEALRNWVIDNTGLSSTDCVCRSCERKFRRQQAQTHDSVSNISTDNSQKLPQTVTEKTCFLSEFGLCQKLSNHERKNFSVDDMMSYVTSISDLAAGCSTLPNSVSMCTFHYYQFYRFCEDKCTHCCKVIKSCKRKRFCPKLTIPQSALKLADSNLSEGSILCNSCYQCLYRSGNLVKGEENLEKCLEMLKSVDVKHSPENIPELALHQVSCKVGEMFLENKSLLLVDAYDFFVETIQMLNSEFQSKEQSEVDMFSFGSKWLLVGLFSDLGPFLLIHRSSSKSTKLSLLLYYKDCDLIESLHLALYAARLNTYKHDLELKSIQSNVASMFTDVNKDVLNSSLLSSLMYMNNLIHQEASKFIDKFVKCPTSLHEIDMFQISKEINPLVWNFIVVLTMQKSEIPVTDFETFDMNEHYLAFLKKDNSSHSSSKFLRRLFATFLILFIVSEGQCSYPFHMINSELIHSYSQSTDLMQLLNRLGVCCSNDSHKRFISGMLDQLKLEDNHYNLREGSFTVASIDNINSGSPHAAVTGSPRGWNGTSIQAVQPKPKSLIVPKLNSTSVCTSEDISVGVDNVTRNDEPVSKKIKLVSKFRPRRRSPKEIENTISLTPPSCVHSVLPSSQSSLTFEQFGISEEEIKESNMFNSEVLLYQFERCISDLTNCSHKLPSLKCKLFLENDPVTEKSNIAYLSIMNENADCKETMLKALNFLHTSFNVGVDVEYLVVVGDAKTFDHLLKLKQEYGPALCWLIIFPGDWHTLKNYQHALMKVYWEGGLKQVASGRIKGQTLLSVGLCKNFKRTHKFLVQVWEAFYRCQIEAFLEHRKNCIDQSSLSSSFSAQTIVDKVRIFLETKPHFGDLGFERDDFLRRQELLKIELEGVEDDFKEFCSSSCAHDEVFLFWHRFIHDDFMAYISLYIAIRSGNWNLRLYSYKKMAPLFHAFDHVIYSRIIPLHLSDLLSCPGHILKYFQEGGFVTSISSVNYSNVALDEGHEMLINRDTKEAITGPNKFIIEDLVLFLPYRAKLIKQVKEQILVKSYNRTQTGLSPIIIEQERQNIVYYANKVVDAHIFSVPEHEDNRHLSQPFTGASISDIQREDLLKFREIGVASLDTFIRFRILNNPSNKAPQRRKSLRTFSQIKITKSRISKSEKDKKLVLECYRRAVSWSQNQNKPLSEIAHLLDLPQLGQFLELPRALCNADGVPHKGAKSATTSFFQSRYPSAFTKMYPTNFSPQCSVLEGMFLINTSPLGQHRTFLEYSQFLFLKWVLPFFQSGCYEVHIVFDDPHRNGLSPKDVERSRRDSVSESENVTPLDSVSDDTITPKDWRKFISLRPNKRLLCSYLCSSLLTVCTPFLRQQQKVFTAGAFTDDKRDMCFVSSVDGISPYPDCRSNHEESDTRVWLHAASSRYENIMIYSPDTDTYHVGLPIVRQTLSGKRIVILLKAEPGNWQCLDVNELLSCFDKDPDLSSLSRNLLPHIIQSLFISTGCDYVSFFVGLGKVSFLKTFFQYSEFISSGNSVQTVTSGSLSCSDKDTGFLAFVRLVGSVYFQKHRTAFLKYSSPAQLFQEMRGDNIFKIHENWLQIIRGAIFERIEFEDNSLPSFQSLWFHWLRSCWVYLTWAQALEQDFSSVLLDRYGWEIDDHGNLMITWDSKENIEKVQKTVEFLTRGCKCKSGCSSKRCKCLKKGQVCGPGCRCLDCSNSICIVQNQVSLDNVETDSDSSSSSDDQDSVQLDSVDDFYCGSLSVLDDTSDSEFSEVE